MKTLDEAIQVIQGPNGHNEAEKFTPIAIEITGNETLLAHMAAMADDVRAGKHTLLGTLMYALVTGVKLGIEMEK